MNRIDVGTMVLVSDKGLIAPQIDRVLEEAATNAIKFIEMHEWCHHVERCYFDRGFDHCRVFFVIIQPLKNADESMFVIVGDLPPAYISSPDCVNGAQALDGYVGELQRWVKQFRETGSVTNCIPVLSSETFEELTPTDELARMIESRCAFIDERILPQWERELE